MDMAFVQVFQSRETSLILENHFPISLIIQFVMVGNLYIEAYSDVLHSINVC